LRQLAPITLVGPGFLGLNTQQATSTVLGPEWATQATNVVFDDANRLASRKGWVSQAVTPISGSPDIEQTFQLITAAGTTAQISAANNRLWSGITAYTDITGAVTVTANDWQFVNFLDNVYGLQAGHALVQWTGSGNATAVAPTSGTVPNGNCLLSAFGRLWGTTSDNQTIKYCGLLDAQNWGSTGSGSINMRAIWTRGTDRVIGLAAFGAALVVFGERHIVIFIDGRGSTLGLDPATIYVVDTIEGTGLLARDSIQNLGEGDLLFLSRTGIQSLQRVIENKTNPLVTVNRSTQDYVNAFVAQEAPGKIRSVYSSVDKFYLLILPTSGRAFCFSTFQLDPTQGQLRTTEWDSMGPRCASAQANGDILLGFAGRLGRYAEFSDNGAQYTLSYVSPHLVGGETFLHNLKIGKALGHVLLTTGTNQVTHAWGYDFKGLSRTLTRGVLGGAIPEYGTAEFGTNGVYNTTIPGLVPGTNISEWGGSVSLRVLDVPISGQGRWIQVGISCPISGSGLAIQELSLYVKAGRMV
jgi:hypothetical protein